MEDTLCRTGASDMGAWTLQLAIAFISGESHWGGQLYVTSSRVEQAQQQYLLQF
jgi:hypothetical protein